MPSNTLRSVFPKAVPGLTGKHLAQILLVMAIAGLVAAARVYPAWSGICEIAIATISALQLQLGLTSPAFGEVKKQDLSTLAKLLGPSEPTATEVATQVIGPISSSPHISDDNAKQ
jgi:hypothetical protein